MKTNTITTDQAYSEKRQNTVISNPNNDIWSPINFQWFPIVNLNNELNKKTNKMKNISILLVAFILTLLSCSKDTITGSGDLISETRNVANFTKLKSQGVFEVMIIQGDNQSIEVIADNNIIHKVKTIVVNNELRLYLDDDDNYGNISVQINITSPSINSLKNYGAGYILALDIDTSDSFYVFNSGSGEIRIEGSAPRLTLENEGSGTFEGFLFTVDDCNVKIIGSGDCNINCANNLNVHIEGSGDVHYIGTPIIETNISGSGAVIHEN